MKLIKYTFLFIILITIGILYDRYKTKIEKDEQMDEYNLIKKYLLNESSLSKSKKPLLWIHLDYEINSRSWTSFGSRTNTNLNQPYLYLSLKTIIDKCSKSFNICLIDDNTFAKIIPGWNIDLSFISKPALYNLRKLALCKILYNYGGMLLPKSFICLKDMLSVHNKCLCDTTMYVGEFVNKTLSSHNKDFLPDIKIMGCERESKLMENLINYLEEIYGTDFTENITMKGKMNNWLEENVKNDNIVLLPGEFIGTKTPDYKPVILDDLFLDSENIFHKQIVGLYVPAHEIIERTKYNWYSRLSLEQVLEAKLLISKFLLVCNDNNLVFYS